MRTATNNEKVAGARMCQGTFYVHATVEKIHFPPVLAQRWENDFETRTDMSIKAERSNAICEGRNSQ